MTKLPVPDQQSTTKPCGILLSKRGTPFLPITSIFIPKSGSCHWDSNP